MVLKARSNGSSLLAARRPWSRLILASAGIGLADVFEVLDRIVLAAEGPDIEIESLAHLLHEQMRLGEQSAGVNKDHLDIRLDLRRQVNQHHRLIAEA